MTPNERLATILREQGRKKIWLSEQTGIPMSTLSDILSGKRKMLATEVASFCNVLSVPASRIVPTRFDEAT